MRTGELIFNELCCGNGHFLSAFFFSFSLSGRGVIMPPSVAFGAKDILRMSDYFILESSMRLFLYCIRSSDSRHEHRAATVCGRICFIKECWCT